MQKIGSWQALYDPGTITFLLLLLIADGLFILLHFLRITPLFDHPLFALDKDLGYPELYLYIKMAWIVVLLLFIRDRTRNAGYMLWALLFLYLLLDDALQLHEKFGVFFATKVTFTTILGLRAQDVGELIIYAMSGILLLVTLAYSYSRRASAIKQVARHLLCLLLALAFFGIVVDMLLIGLDLGWKVDYVLAAVEDGGEMVVVSLITAYLYALSNIFARGRNVT